MRYLLLILCFGLVSCGGSKVEMVEILTPYGLREIPEDELEDWVYPHHPERARVVDVVAKPGESSEIWIEPKADHRFVGGARRGEIYDDKFIRESCTNTKVQLATLEELGISLSDCLRTKAELRQRILYLDKYGRPPWRLPQPGSPYEKKGWDPVMPTDKQLREFGFERVEGHPRAFRRLGN